jgi:hypothetical protein
LRCAGCGASVSARGRVFEADELGGGTMKKGKKTSVEGKEKADGLALPILSSTAATPVPPSSTPPVSQRPTSSILRKNPPLLIGFSMPTAAIKDAPLYDGYTVELKPGCYVHHLWPNCADGYVDADKLFEAYQGEEAGKLFVRNKLTCHKCPSDCSPSSCASSTDNPALDSCRRAPLPTMYVSFLPFSLPRFVSSSLPFLYFPSSTASLFFLRRD